MNQGNDLMEKITVNGEKKQLATVLNFIEKNLNQHSPSPKFIMQLELSIEEIFINIVEYAYKNDSNQKITISYNSKKDPQRVIISFLDEGTPYNPLSNPDPDITLPLKEREIGGLGLFLVKKNVDNINYEYKDKKNILTIEKHFEN